MEDAFKGLLGIAWALFVGWCFLKILKYALIFIIGVI